VGVVVVDGLEKLPHLRLGKIQFVILASRTLWLGVYLQFLNYPHGEAGKFEATRHVDVLHASLDGVIEFVASESSHVEKDFSQGISHSRFGTLQTFDKGFVALAWRPSHRGEIAEAIATLAGPQECVPR